jgi:hypothetical protein
MTKRLKPAAEVMSPGAGLHPDQAGRHVGEARFNLAARPPLSQHNGTAPILPNSVERILSDIDTHHGHRGLHCLRHGVLLSISVPTA